MRRTTERHVGLWRALLVTFVLMCAPHEAYAGGLKDLLKKGGEALAKKGTQAAGRSLLSARRSVEDVQVLARVAVSLRPQWAAEVEQLLKRASAGETLTDAEWKRLDEIASELEAPLQEAAKAVTSGKKVPLVGTRALRDGARMIPGSAEHQAQCWVEYQLRYPDKYPSFSYEMEPAWRRQYRSILDNKPAGSAFEESVLEARGYEKNTAMMMPPPGSGEQGFIADSVRDKVGEFVWGRPYNFVEVKARQELAFTGNLKAMLDYVDTYGGHLEIWIRSARHPDGATRLTAPLGERIQLLVNKGMASLEYHP